MTRRVPNTLQEAELMDEVAHLRAKLRHSEITIKMHEDYIVSLTKRMHDLRDELFEARQEILNVRKALAK